MKRGYRIIGLTGGIGAGKSAAAARFAALGAHVIDADVLARAALDQGSVCYGEAVSAFGKQIVREDGQIDRKALAGIVFSDPKQLARLNAIIHPRVISDMLVRARAITASDADTIAVLDVPLLFECRMERSVDVSLLVYADDALRIGRVVARDGCTAGDADARIRAQMPQTEKLMLTDYALCNDGPIEALSGQVDALYQLFRSKNH